MPKARSPHGVIESASRETPGSRRLFLFASACAAAIVSVPALAAEPVPDRLAPDVALRRLVEGNDRFVRQKLTSFDEDLEELRRGTAEKQEPFAAILSCADSRIPVELVFDQSIGRLFVTRVAGNVASTEMIASLEYGAAVLGVSLILVLAHQSCGAVKAAIAAGEVPGQISALYAPLHAAVAGGGDVDHVAKANAVVQANILAKASPVLADLIKSGRLKIAAAFYDLSSGRVTLL